jgi:hypothetical protein
LRSVKSKIIKQEAALKSTGDVDGKKFFTVEKERAIHLGVHPRGPIKVMMLNARIKPGHLPSL